MNSLLETLNEWEVDVKVVDKRTGMIKFPSIIDDNIVLASGKTLRPYQAFAVKTVVDNHLS